MSYDSNSSDAMFSRVLERLERQDASLARIEAGVAKTNGRVNALERWRDIITAKTAIIAGALSIAVSVALQYFFK